MHQFEFARSPGPAAIWAGMLVIYIVWGSTYLGMRFAIETMPPFLMASFRFLTAGVILYTWRRLSGDPAPTRANWRSAAIIGLFLLLGGNGGVVWAEQAHPIRGRRLAGGFDAFVDGDDR